MTILELVQNTLDTALYSDVLSYWQKKTGPDADEYVVYTRSGDSSENFADDVPLTKNAGITVQYYYRAELVGTEDGRETVENRGNTIREALEAAGFYTDGGFDVGDVDDIGYLVTVFECEYWRVV